MLAMGSPARVTKELKPEQVAAKRRSTQGYVQLAAIAQEQSALVEPQRPAEALSGASAQPAAHWTTRWLVRMGLRRAATEPSLAI
jgi:hypothetical protein